MSSIRRRLVSATLGVALTCGLTTAVVTGASGSVTSAPNQVTSGPSGPPGAVTPAPAIRVDYLG